MLESKENITIFLGTFNENNEYRLEEIKAEYSPFIRNFHKFGEFLNWQKDITTPPLLRDRYLALIYLKTNYKYFETIIGLLLEYENNNIELVLVIEPRERFFNIPDVGINIIDLSKYISEDFNRKLDIELPKLTESGRKTLLNRIGFNYTTLNAYLDELKEYETIDSNVIKKVVKESRISPIEFILYDLLIHGRVFRIREHYKLCDKYSERWTLNMYSKLLEDVINLKRDIKLGKITFSEMSANKNYRKLKPLVRDTKIIQVYILKIMIEKYKNVAIEMYLMTNSYSELLNLLKDSIEYEPFSWEVDEIVTDND